MTDHQDLNEPAASPLLVIEAFIDGERVDPGALKQALGDPAARDHLVDLLMLRGAVADVTATGWSAAHRPWEPRSRLRWVAAAAAVIVSLTAGYMAGQRTLVPPVEASSIVVQVDSAPPPPAPTQVITLRPGVNWTEVVGEK